MTILGIFQKLQNCLEFSKMTVRTSDKSNVRDLKLDAFYISCQLPHSIIKFKKDNTSVFNIYV